IVKLTETGEHSRFPHLAFLDLAVAQKSVYSVGVVAEFRGKSHSHCRGDTLSERSAGHIHARDMFHIRMSLKIGTQMTESLQIFFGEVSSLCQNRIQRSEEHTSELQSRFELVCRLLLETKK